MSSTERVRRFRERHGLVHRNLLGELKVSGMRPPTPRARRRARKAQPVLQPPEQTAAQTPAPPAAPPLAPLASAVTVQIPGMNTIAAPAAPAPLPVSVSLSERATVPPLAAESIAA
jgi:hypothetical protein